MLTIRMQRKGRTGHAQFRVVVQDSRFHPSSGRVVAYVGSYDPHTKAATLDGEKIGKYLQNGAQPSERVAKLLSNEGIKVPEWFKVAVPKKGVVRNPNKRRSTRPAEAKSEEPAAAEKPDSEAAEVPAFEAPDEKPAEAPAEEPASETEAPAPEAEAPAEETPAKEPKV
ncbi:30S ribosomal protein S16 [bacterium I07]|nr:30S ribosomal protein S16 [bacterium I07]